MESTPAPPAVIENPYGLEDTLYPDPGVWLLSPVPMAFVCFGIAACAARVAGRRFEWVGAAAALVAGLAILAMLQHETERLLDNVRAHWPWLYAVTLLGIAGGLAARVFEPHVLTRGRLPIEGLVAVRMVTATLVGCAIMVVPVVAFLALVGRGAGAWSGWALSLVAAAGTGYGGWIVARLAPRFPIPCAIAAVYLPLAVAPTFAGGMLRDLDVMLGVLALLSVPAAVAAYISSTRSQAARTARESESDGFGFELLRVTAFGAFAAALLAGVWSMSRENCGMRRERLAKNVEYVGRIRSPADAVAVLEASGLTVRHVSGGLDGYRLEIDEPSTTCNFYSPKTIVARHPR